MSYFNAFPPSFTTNNYIAAGALGDLSGGTKTIPFKDLNFAANPPISIADAYSGKFDLSGSAFNTAWTFICAPEDISWDTSNAVQRVGIFGTNSPPVVSGSRGMRDLTLGNALVEGFIRNVTVENKIVALEKLLNYNLNASDGFVSVPVYQIWANQKAYGKTGYFVIKDVRVKETMRDLKGDATRATVDVSFMEVPKYQVNSGRDLASQKAAAAKAALIDPKALRGQRQAASNTAAQDTANQKVGTPGTPAAGAGVPKDKKPAVQPQFKIEKGKPVEYNYQAPPRP
jgi:hypothetical protein